MNFKEVFDEAPVGVLIAASSDHKIVYANPSFLSHSLYTFDELQGRKDNELFIEKKNSKTSKKGPLVDTGVFLKKKDSSEVAVKIRTVDTKSETVGSIKLCYVIPLQANPESREEKMNSVFFKAIMDNFADRIYFKDQESRFLKVNKVFLNELKLDPEAVLGKTDFDLFSEEHAREAYDDEQQILKTRKPIFKKEEKETFRGSEEDFWVITSKLPLYDEKNELIGTFGVSRDITQLKKAEMRAREGLNILHAITNNVPILIFRFEKAKNLFEFIGSDSSKAAFLSSKFARLRVKDNLAYIIDVVLKNRDEQGYINFSSSFSNDNEVQYFENYVFKSLSSDTNYIGFSLDATERKTNEHHIRKHTKNLEKINKELNQFAYIISHDLKTPLRAITNLSEWIEEDLKGYGEGEVMENLQLLRNRVLRFENLINGILNYSRATRDTAIEKNIDVSKVIKETAAMISIPKNFILHIEDNIPKIDFNKTNLERIFTHLISNAIKHHDKSRGTIRVEYYDSGGYHEFAVADDGPGVPKEYHEKIFVIFQTLQSRDTFESTGIGLTIVKKIIEDRGGEIWIESEEGKGSKFVFTIPKIIN